MNFWTNNPFGGKQLPQQLTDRLAEKMSINARKTVLLADDDELFTAEFKELETKLNMEIVVTRSCAETERLIKECHFDIMILDYFLVNGISVALYQEIVSRQPQARVIFITGGTLDEVSRQVHSIGPAPCYPKPSVANLGFVVNLLREHGVRLLRT